MSHGDHLGCWRAQGGTGTAPSVTAVRERRDALTRFRQVSVDCFIIRCEQRSTFFYLMRSVFLSPLLFLGSRRAIASVFYTNKREFPSLTLSFFLSHMLFLDLPLHR